MASNLSTVIMIDPYSSAIHFYSMVGKDKNTISHEVKSYKARALDEEFFEKFKEILHDYAVSSPSAQAAKVTLVLPDFAIGKDVINIPVVGKSAMERSLNITIDSLYADEQQLKINTVLSAQNKQFYTYSLTTINQQLLANVYGACSTNKMMAYNVTYASNAMVNSALSINGKLKSASFVMLDIKQAESNVAFVVKGRTAGSYRLSFGSSIFEKPIVAAEDMLFDHTVAELAVINAKERARAKQLTMMGDENMDAVNVDGTVNEDGEQTPAVVNNEAVNTPVIKVLGKKVARKLPKWMQRPLPESPEGFAYENFRIFEKWVLTLIQQNDRILAQSKPDFVLVNMPSEYSYLFDMINQEQDDNGIKFVQLDVSKEKPIVRDNLELYGAFYVKQFNHDNNF